jgi:hypothetical protein
MLAIGVGWQSFALSHPAIDLGLVGLVQFAPAVALTLAAGKAADRRDRTGSPRSARPPTVPHHRRRRPRLAHPGRRAA